MKQNSSVLKYKYVDTYCDSVLLKISYVGTNMKTIFLDIWEIYR